MKTALLSVQITILLTLIASCAKESAKFKTDGGSDTDSDGDSDRDSDSNENPCEPPDMLIVLDRTMSMHRQPSGDPAPQNQHELSKWYLAINAIETVTTEYEERLRFGLELFPRDPDDGSCVTLTERIDGKTATNSECDQGEMLISPNTSTASAIALALDPETTLLCNTTPIGAGLNTAATHLAKLKSPIRPQYALLVTDGQDTCETPDPVKRVQALAAAFVSTFVVGFDSSGKGIDPKTLNNMACAGRTAPDFDNNCVDQGGGSYVAANPSGTMLFISASDGVDLQNELGTVAGLVGCGVVQ